MRCERRLLSEYYDGELSPGERLEVQAHLATCAECRMVLQQYRAVGLALRAAERRPAPASLAARFHAQTAARAPTLSSRLAGLLALSGRNRPLILGALGTVAAALVMALALNFAVPRPQDSLTVVAAYPPDGATGVVLDEPIEVVFSEPVKSTDVEVQLEPAVPVESTRDGNKLILKPKEPLQPDTSYVVRVEPRKPAGQASAPAPAAPSVTLRFSTGRTVAAAASATATAGPALASASTPAAPSAPSAPPTQAPKPATAVAVAAAPAAPAPTVPAAGPTPTARPATVAAAAPARPQASPMPCAAEIGQRTAAAFQQRPELRLKLGCTLVSERALPIVEQTFDGGVMLWRVDKHEIEVLLASGRWSSYSDAATVPGSPSPTRAVGAAGAPAGALGKLWQDRLDVRGSLGSPMAPEASRLAHAQTFLHGTALVTDAGTTYVLFDDGTWQRLAASPMQTATPGPATPSAPPAPTSTATAPIGTPTATASPASTPAGQTPTPAAVTPTPTGPASPTATPTTASPTPGPAPTATPTSTATATPAPSDDSAGTPTATPAAPSPTATPTAPATAPTSGISATPVQTKTTLGVGAGGLRAARSQDLSLCDVPVAHGFGLLYGTREGLAARLGCAIASERSSQAAEEFFEGGYVFWRADVRQVYALYDDGTWAIYADTWRDGDPEKSGETPPSGRQEPVRGIGRVWRESPGVRDRLAWAMTSERGFTGAAQPFERGLMLSSNAKRIYVLYADGTWESSRDEYRESAR